jgi:hypothetical protein
MTTLYENQPDTPAFDAEEHGLDAARRGLSLSEALTEADAHDDGIALECECGAGPFADRAAVEAHKEQWHD